MPQGPDGRNIIVIIPTYNEAENIQQIIEGVFSLGINASCLVIDDNSPDGTARLVEALKVRYTNLHLITREKKLGFHSAYIEFFNYSLKSGYNTVVQMDADLSHQPADIPSLVSLLDKYDLVIASRYIKGGGVLNWPLQRVLLSRLANLFAKTLLGIPINDLTSGFKAMKRGVLENINFSGIASKGYAFQIEMCLRAFRKNISIIEYPIIFQGRRKEKSKMSAGVILEAILKVLFLSFKRKTDE